MVEIENLKKDILDLITPYLTKRAGKFYIENEEYKESSKTADLIFEELNETLTDEQQELLERYFTANNATVALYLNIFVKEKISLEFPELSEA